LAQIQALPSSIAKVTGYNIDNTYFPFMEYYKASDAETSALRESIKFNGMAIGVIGTIADYTIRYDQDTPVYVCGRPILLENEIGDTQWLTAIKNEIQTGE
ncbi:MAG: hypothetical protein MJ053_07150, partial [Elusimicrobiaceae bacterium]|nr:hypothetical protein [Elusimicrobiaceae bacterium]